MESNDYTNMLQINHSIFNCHVDVKQRDFRREIGRVHGTENYNIDRKRILKRLREKEFFQDGQIKKQCQSKEDFISYGDDYDDKISHQISDNEDASLSVHDCCITFNHSEVNKSQITEPNNKHVNSDEFDSSSGTQQRQAVLKNERSGTSPGILLLELDRNAERKQNTKLKDTDKDIEEGEIVSADQFPISSFEIIDLTEEPDSSETETEINKRYDTCSQPIENLNARVVFEKRKDESLQKGKLIHLPKVPFSCRSSSSNSNDIDSECESTQNVEILSPDESTNAETISELLKSIKATCLGRKKIIAHSEMEEGEIVSEDDFSNNEMDVTFITDSTDDELNMERSSSRDSYYSQIQSEYSNSSSDQEGFLHNKWEHDAKVIPCLFQKESGSNHKCFPNNVLDSEQNIKNETNICRHLVCSIMSKLLPPCPEPECTSNETSKETILPENSTHDIDESVPHCDVIKDELALSEKEFFQDGQLKKQCLSKKNLISYCDDYDEKISHQISDNEDESPSVHDCCITFNSIEVNKSQITQPKNKHVDTDEFDSSSGTQQRQAVLKNERSVTNPGILLLELDSDAERKQNMKLKNIDKDIEEGGIVSADQFPISSFETIDLTEEPGGSETEIKNLNKRYDTRSQSVENFNARVVFENQKNESLQEGKLLHLPKVPLSYRSSSSDSNDIDSECESTQNVEILSPDESTNAETISELLKSIKATCLGGKNIIAHSEMEEGEIVSEDDFSNNEMDVTFITDSTDDELYMERSSSRDSYYSQIQSEYSNSDQEGFLHNKWEHDAKVIPCLFQKESGSNLKCFPNNVLDSEQNIKNETNICRHLVCSIMSKLLPPCHVPDCTPNETSKETILPENNTQDIGESVPHCDVMNDEIALSDVMAYVSKGLTLETEMILRDILSQAKLSDLNLNVVDMDLDSGA